jgi:hypothetical protein
MPYHRECAAGKHALNDFLSIDGGGASILDAAYNPRSSVTR